MTTYNKLYENWMNSLNEEDVVKVVRNAKNIPYTKFVQWLQKNVNDEKVKVVIALGQKDGDQTDDTFAIQEGSIPCSSLRPTQNEVDIDKSLAFPLGWAAGAEKGAKSFLNLLNSSGKGIKLGPNPIVTFGGKFVIDGHHRWSQAYCINPKVKMDTMNMTNDELKPLDVLKAVQMSIANSIGEVPVQSVEGSNLFGADESTIAEAMKKIPDEWYELVMKYGAKTVGKPEILGAGSVEELKSKLLPYVWKNVQIMNKNSPPAKGSGPRDFMPQTDNAENWPDALKAGEIDINSPHGEIKESLNISNQRLRQIILEEIRRSKK